MNIKNSVEGPQLRVENLQASVDEKEQQVCQEELFVEVSQVQNSSISNRCARVWRSLPSTQREMDVDGIGEVAFKHPV